MEPSLPPGQPGTTQSRSQRLDSGCPPALRRGVVAVIARADRLLVIRRAETVEAPGTYCFPGGAIETEETEEAAVRRELREELGVDGVPIRRIWRSVTPWHVDLCWWLVDLAPSASLQPNPAEVASVHWLTPDEIRALATLLTSNHQFLAALERGELSLARA